MEQTRQDFDARTMAVVEIDLDETIRRVMAATPSFQHRFGLAIPDHLALRDFHILPFVQASEGSSVGTLALLVDKAERAAPPGLKGAWPVSPTTSEFVENAASPRRVWPEISAEDALLATEAADTSRRQFSLRMFGEPQVFDGEIWHDLPGGTATDLLSTLTMHHPLTLSAQDLGELAWSQPVRSFGSVYTAMSRLRSTLARLGRTDMIKTSPQGYRLTLSATQVDTLAFAKGALVLDPGVLGAALYVKQARELLVHFVGTPYGGCVSPAAEAARSRLFEARATMEERICVREITLGATASAVELARTLTAREKWRESAWAILMVALYRSGRQREALETYRVARRMLINSVGVEPGPMLREIERFVLEQNDQLLQQPFTESLAA